MPSFSTTYSRSLENRLWLFLYLPPASSFGSRPSRSKLSTPTAMSIIGFALMCGIAVLPMC